MTMVYLLSSYVEFSPKAVSVVEPRAYRPYRGLCLTPVVLRGFAAAHVVVLVAISSRTALYGVAENPTCMQCKQATRERSRAWKPSDKQ
jgi:hypothetical protein